jgi:ketosteroid isomerase-like protein
MGEKDSPESLERAIAAYNEAWNSHDLDAIMALHAPDMVFENHTAGESAQGDDVRGHIGSIMSADRAGGLMGDTDELSPAVVAAGVALASAAVVAAWALGRRGG